MKRRLLFALCLLPGTTSTIFVVLSMLNGGILLGIPLNHFIICSLLALPLFILGFYILVARS
jgi:hypothetical protein